MLAGKIALVTGASRGIGQATAVALGKAGATVVGTATSDAGAAGYRLIWRAKISRAPGSSSMSTIP